MNKSDVVLSGRGLKKKFSREMRVSLKYSLNDFFGELFCLRKKERQLRKKEFWAVRDIDVTLRRGQIMAFLGANGAGKTTTLRLLNGVLKPDAGEIQVLGDRVSLSGLQAAFNGFLTGKQNVYLLGTAMGCSRKYLKERMTAITEVSGLQEAMDASLCSYSAGMRMRLAFGLIAQTEPDVLFLDSIFGAADAQFREEYPDIIRRLSKTAGVIVAAHNLEMIRKLCNSVVVFEAGRKIYEGEDVEMGIQCCLTSKNGGRECNSR